MSTVTNPCAATYKELVEVLRAPVWVIGADGVVQYANRAATALVGQPLREATSFCDYIGWPEDECRRVMPEAWWQSSALSDEWEAVDNVPDIGTQSVTRVLRRRVMEADGTYWALLMFEMASAWEKRYLETLRRQDGLAHALEAAEERFNVLFRESSDPVLILNPDGDILSANAGFERFTGVRVDSWIREEKGWADCVNPDDLLLMRERIAYCAREGQADLLELRLLNGEGFYQWFELSLSPLHDEQRNVRGMVGVARNINRRKELESQLREKAQSMQKRHQRAQLLIAKLKHFFGRVSALPSDIDGYLNGVCDTLSDMYRPYAVSIHVPGKEERVYVRGGEPSLSPDRHALPETLRQAVWDSGLPQYFNSLNLTDPYRDDPAIQRGGFITFLGAPLRDSTGTIRGVLSVLDTEKQYYDNVDVELITVAALHVAARLRAEEQEETNRELSDHLRQAQKMEAVGMLAGGIAHDFNNILSGILGFSSYLLSKVEPASTIHRDLKLIEQSAVRAAELTRQLLSFARRTNFAKDAVSMNKVIEEVLGLVRRSVPKHITVSEQLDAELPPVQGDPGQLNQVIMNLCLNAADAMKGMERGTLRLATERRLLTPRERIILADKSEDEFVCVTVSDSGVGMSEAMQEHIYEPFFTTKSDHGGTGLGLSMVYGIVTNHGGYVMVDSEEGDGSVFTIYLPVFRGRMAAGETDAVGPLTGNETVLVVDDEPIVRQMVTQVLRGNGYQVVAAQSGMEAVHFLDELRGRVDLVLLDMIMPEMDGEATFKALRRIDPAIPILLTSGFVQEDKGERLIQAGALGLVYKPYKSGELLRCVRGALDGVPCA